MLVSSVDMVIEQATVLAVGANTVLLETINRSACAQCAAKSSCGQSTLAGWMETSNQLTIALPDKHLQPGDLIEISLESNLLAKAALVVYLLPLLLLLLGSVLAHQVSATDASAFAGAVVGLASGLLAVSLLTKVWSKQLVLTPVFHQLIKANSLN
ncbi:SoxR reducing system RseC family protein [Simiduia curdlanivorans]|uniref:SoxR reducing system RseC family protein n=1 Tax=Simiduia curdlanivorans TaxID=1492769 RepID=A0ABV8V7I6_9GAMM|nr:SoxR reducing system RseC family protein [Simiduia curdlanivorans]MDN3639798.1 SoxR reducing system RseC family protein [Simiduia curdlanivorans]